MSGETRELAYLVGVFQSDACIYRFVDRKKANRTIYFLSLNVARRSLGMMTRFRELLRKHFRRQVSVRVDTRGYFVMKTSINGSLGELKRLGAIDETAPAWVTRTPMVFGAFLAGLIDGDGTICVRRPAYPQLTVSIFRGRRSKVLVRAIHRWFRTPVQIESRKNHLGRSCAMRFYLSTKNIKFFLDAVYPYLAVEKKRAAVQKYVALELWRNRSAADILWGMPLAPSPVPPRYGGAVSSKDLSLARKRNEAFRAHQDRRLYSYRFEESLPLHEWGP